MEEKTEPNRKSRWVWKEEDVQMTEKQPEDIQEVADRVKWEQRKYVAEAIENARALVLKYEVLMSLEKLLPPTSAEFLHILETRKAQSESMIIKMNHTLERLS